MGQYVTESLIKLMAKSGVPISGAKVAVLGLTFKENCPDTRNSRVVDIIHELHEYGIEPVVCDDVADKDGAEREYGLELTAFERVKNCDAVILAVAHDEFKALSRSDFDALYKNETKILLDVKGILDRKTFESAGYKYWRL